MNTPPPDWRHRAANRMGVLLAAVVSLSCNAHGEEAWEIKHRTVFHSDAPDDRTDFGIGEWVVFSILPESAHEVEWTMTGDGELTNRFGNTTILIVGGTPNAGQLTVGAKPREKGEAAAGNLKQDGPKSGPPASVSGKEDPPKGKTWLDVGAEFNALAALAKEPTKFDAHCKEVLKTLRTLRARPHLKAAPLAMFGDLVNQLNTLQPQAPGSFDWAKLRSTTLECAILRLAVGLDGERDKSKLDAEFWKLSATAVAGLHNLNKEFEAAGGKDNVELISLRVLLRVQFINALPGLTGDVLKQAFAEKGFGPDDYALLFEEEPRAEN